MNKNKSTLEVKMIRFFCYIAALLLNVLSISNNPKYKFIKVAELLRKHARSNIFPFLLARNLNVQTLKKFS